MRGAAKRSLRSPAERNALVEQYLPLVRYVAARLPVTMPSSLDRDDFYSVGVLGLLHAAATYDPSRGASFKTFAYTAIRGSILDEIRRHDPVPRSRRERLRDMEQAASTLSAVLQRPASLEELGEHLGVSSAELDESLLAVHTCRMLSIDEFGLSGDDPGRSVAQSLACEVEPDPAEYAARRDDLRKLAGAISELPNPDRHVVMLYHHEGLFLKEIGQILGVTESRVSQILSRAMARLRLKLQDPPSD